jgi:hypothetical protein
MGIGFQAGNSLKKCAFSAEPAGPDQTDRSRIGSRPIQIVVAPRRFRAL